VKRTALPPAALLAATASLVGAAPAVAQTRAVAATGRAEGLIRELPRPTHVGDIAAGGDGELWFEIRHPAAIGWMTATGKPHRFRLPKGVEPNFIAIGREGSAWFTFDEGGLESLGFGGGGVGRVTHDGEVSLFAEPPNKSGGPFEIIVGPDGNLWYDHAGAFTAEGGAIGRITPSGEVTEFTAGLRPSAQVEGLIAGNDGNVWFADTGTRPAIGRITPAGDIVEFSGLRPVKEYSFLTGPAPAGSKAVYFSANGPGPIAVERMTPGGAISRFRAGLAHNVVGLGPFLGGRKGDAWFRVERHAGAGTTAAPDGRVAIGHISAGGKIREYSRCLRPMQDFEGPEQFLRGPEGNIWFVTRTSGRPGYTKRSATPSVGRITPTGKITEFRYGLRVESELERLTFAAGRLWFLDDRNGQIGEMIPPRHPANTFQVLRLRRGNSATPAVELAVPGPGTVRLRELGHRRGLAATRSRARACGPTTIRVAMRPPLVRRLRRHGVVYLNASLTFAPRGGSPFTEPVEIEVGSPE
jgi:streptogramin lyase